MNTQITNKYILLLSSIFLLSSFFIDAKAQKIDSLDWSEARKSAYRSLNGVGTELNYKRAYLIFKRLGKSGDAESVNAMGIMYKQGLGIKQNDKEAFRFFKKASEMGNIKATYNLGLAYRFGSGVEQDFKKAYELFEETKHSGSTRTDYALGYCHYKGLGVKQDYTKAAEYFTAGAEKGNPACMFNLGQCYFLGRGVDRNSELGKVWSEKSALKGFNRAIDFIARVDSKTYGEPKVRTRASSSHSLDAQIPLTHQIVKMPTQTRGLKSTLNNTSKNISGQWVGKIITYDWSGKEIEEEVDL